RMTNDENKARAAFTAARNAQAKRVQEQPDCAPAISMLGLIDASWSKRGCFARRQTRDGASSGDKGSQQRSRHDSKLRHHCRVGGRKTARLRSPCRQLGIARPHQLWPPETAPLVGPASGRSAL